MFVCPSRHLGFPHKIQFPFLFCEGNGPTTVWRCFTRKTRHFLAHWSTFPWLLTQKCFHLRLWWRWDPFNAKRQYPFELHRQRVGNAHIRHAWTNSTLTQGPYFFLQHWFSIPKQSRLDLFSLKPALFWPCFQPFASSFWRWMADENEAACNSSWIRIGLVRVRRAGISNKGACGAALLGGLF